MSNDEACCTCASFINHDKEWDEKTEKTIPSRERRLECCGRVICSACIDKNSRFSTYCPFCQVSITPSPLPQGLRDPPTYDDGEAKAAKSIDRAQPPTYSQSCDSASGPEGSNRIGTADAGEDVLHFIDLQRDTITLLSLLYGVPAWALRAKNNLNSDHLLAARKTILIPGEFYKGGVSLSPRPPDGEEAEKRKTAIRRFMTTCKVHDYNEAQIYLQQAQYDLQLAIGVYQDDERWQRENPMSKSKAKRK